jgi:hypothetical protein
LPIFLERFVLTVLAGVLITIVLVNPLKMDWQQQLSLGIAIVAFAYFIGRTLENQKKLQPNKADAQRVEQSKELKSSTVPINPKMEAVPAPQNFHYLPEITITRNAMALRIYQDGEVYRWTLKGGPRRIGECHLKCESAQVFDAEVGFMLDHQNINGYLGTVPGLSGNHLSRVFVFARFLSDGIHLGDKSFRLKWPTGDPTNIERWLVHLNVEPLTWSVRLVVKWVHGTTSLEFMEYRDNMPVSAF